MDENKRVNDIFMQMSMEHLRETMRGIIFDVVPSGWDIINWDDCLDEVCKASYEAAEKAQIPLNDLKAMKEIIYDVAPDIVESHSEEDAERYDDEGGNWSEYSDE